jgi:hypothetical protein
MGRKSRWLDWQPSRKKFCISLESEPTKPSKPCFVGFDGSVPRQIQTFFEVQPALQGVEERPAIEAWLEVQEREAEPEPAYCPACRQARFWVSVHGAVVCGICHPPASPRLVERWSSTLDGSGSINPAEIAPTLNSQGGPPSLAEVEAMLPAGLRVLSFEPKPAPLVVSPVLTLTEIGRFFRRYLQDLAWRAAHPDTASVAPLADILGKLRAAGLDLITEADLPRSLSVQEEVRATPEVVSCTEPTRSA